MNTLLALSEVVKPPYLLASAQAGLTWGPSPMLPSEILTDADPPSWGERNERWTIDTLLGCYHPRLREVTIFTKGINFAAEDFGLPADIIEYIVRIHEWGHAVFHVGLDSGAATTLVTDPQRQTDMISGLTNCYSSVDTFVHEQMAQAITWLALEGLRADATIEDSKRACASLCDAFEVLTRRQPRQYRLDPLRHLDANRLRARLRDLICLIRSGGIRGDEKTWQAITAWD